MKKRALHGLGLALLLASPIWITMAERPNYFTFAISAVLGILLMVMAHYTAASGS